MRPNYTVCNLSGVELATFENYPDASDYLLTLQGHGYMKYSTQVIDILNGINSMLYENGLDKVTNPEILKLGLGIYVPRVNPLMLTQTNT